MSTAYITHPVCLEHNMGYDHPESPGWLMASEAFRPEMMSGKIEATKSRTGSLFFGLDRLRLIAIACAID